MQINHETTNLAVTPSGTLRWLSPEELAGGMRGGGGGGGGSEKSDVWSLGCVLLELASCGFMDVRVILHTISSAVCAILHREATTLCSSNGCTEIPVLWTRLYRKCKRYCPYIGIILHVFFLSRGINMSCLESICFLVCVCVPSDCAGIFSEGKNQDFLKLRAVTWKYFFGIDHIAHLRRGKATFSPSPPPPPHMSIVTRSEVYIPASWLLFNVVCSLQSRTAGDFHFI